MRKKPFTNKELFNEIVRILKESNKLPDILDYALSDSLNENMINSYEFDSLFKLDWGGNEGIHLDVAITGCVDGESKVISLGTFKTLLETDEAMHQMAALEADLESLIRCVTLEMITSSKEECLLDMQFLWI